MEDVCTRHVQGFVDGAQELVDYAVQKAKAHRNADDGIQSSAAATLQHHQSLDTPNFQSWQTLMTEVFGQFTPDQLADGAASAAKFNDKMRDTFGRLLELRAAGRHGPSAQPTVDVFIASDANAMFIQGILQRHFPTDVLPPLHTHIHTNPVLWDSTTQRSFVIPYTAPCGGHSCLRCNVNGTRNLCKGRIVEFARRHAAVNCQDATVVYIGDGINDSCPLAHLRGRDIFCVRRHHALEKRLVQEGRLHSDAHTRAHDLVPATCWEQTSTGTCNVVSWESFEALAATIDALIDPRADDMQHGAAGVRQIIQKTQRLLRAPLFTFGEDNWSFRRITLSHRMTATVKHTLQWHRDEAVISPDEAQFIDCLAEEVRRDDHVSRGTLMPVVAPHESTKSLQVTDDDIDAVAVSRSKSDSQQRRWCDLIDTACRVAHFPSPLVAYRREGTGVFKSHFDALGHIEWSRMPWLQGEILFHRILTLAFEQQVVQSSSSVEPSTAAASSVQPSTAAGGPMRGSVDYHDALVTDHCVVCSTPHGALRCGCAFVAFARREQLPRSVPPAINDRRRHCHADVFQVDLDHPCAPVWDQYRFEKKEMIETTLDSHIALTTDVLYSKVLEVQALLDAARGDEALEDVRRCHVAPLLEILLLNSLWGNAVDLCLTQSSNVRSPTASAPESLLPSRAGGYAAITGALLLKVADGFVVGNNLNKLADIISHAIVVHRLGESVAPRGDDGGEERARLLDVVMDNAGVECAADLLLAVAVARLATSVVDDGRSVLVCMHCKPMPWYVSDVVPHDIALILAAIRGVAPPTRDGGNVCEQFAEDCAALMSSRSVALRPSTVWTSATEFREHGVELFDRFYERRVSIHPVDVTAPICPVRFDYVGKTRLVIFKGDLNFRRVVGDRHWEEVVADPDGCDAVPFSTAVGDYWPTSAVAIGCLRTCKCELVCGVPTEKCKALDAAHEAGRPALPPSCAGDAAFFEPAVKWIKSGWRVAGTHAVALVAAE